MENNNNNNIHLEGEIDVVNEHILISDDNDSNFYHSNLKRSCVRTIPWKKKYVREDKSCRIIK